MATSTARMNLPLARAEAISDDTGDNIAHVPVVSVGQALPTAVAGPIAVASPVEAATIPLSNGIIVAVPSQEKDNAPKTIWCHPFTPLVACFCLVLFLVVFFVAYFIPNIGS